jgi:hypothetical protein
MSSIPDRPWIVRAERVIRTEGLCPEDEPILRRLMTDPRMDRVWTQLTRHSRSHTGKYYYSARRLPDEPERDPEEARQHALA